MDCPKCCSNSYCKDGKANGRQRYLCKECKYRYTLKQRSGTGNKAVRRQALELYLEGLGFRSIGRVLNFSNVSILNWIREFGSKLEELKSEKQVKVIEMDEMHSYVANKKTIAGYGLLLIEIGINSSTTLLASGTPRQEKNSGKGLQIRR